MAGRRDGFSFRDGFSREVSAVAAVHPGSPSVRPVFAVPCPDETALLDYTEGRPVPGLEAHLDGCWQCSELLAELAVALEPPVGPEPPPSEPAADAGADRDGFLAPGTRIGPFLVTALAGVGGMGAVYRAHDPRLRRDVALKVLHEVAGIDPSRLRDEARVLARLRHRNVVEALDVGVHDGRVYLVQRFVAGVSLDVWLALRRRPTSEILATFGGVAAGLGAAHGAHLVHRDLKPRNVLVDNKGHAFVTDFGLASESESAADGGPQRPDRDRPALLAGTPAYMAPEQLRGERATAASDQFAFCLMLFEALTNAPAFPGATAGARLRAIERGAITLGAASLPTRLRAALTRGLCADPQARFASMSDLAAALRPVAHPRRQPMVAAALAGVATVWIASAESTASGDPCQGVADAAAEAWNEGKRDAIAAAFAATGRPHAELATARTTAELDAFATAWMRARHRTCSRARSGEIGAETADRLRACEARQLGRARVLVGALENANAEAVDRATTATARLAKNLECDEVPPAPEELHVRALVDEAAVLEELGQLDTARERIDSAASRVEPLDAAALEARVLLHRGSLADREGRPQHAADLLQTAYETATAQGADDVAARAATNLIFIHGYTLADPQAASLWIRHADVAVRRAGEHRSEWLLYTAVLAGQDGRHGEALVGYLAAFVGFRLSAGPEDPSLAITLQNAGSSLAAIGEHDAAAWLYAAALHRLQPLLGDSHPDVAAVQGNLGDKYADLGRYDEARALLEASARTRRSLFEPDHPAVLLSQESLAQLDTATGRSAAARERHRAVLAARERLLGPDHPMVAWSLTNLAAVNADLDDCATASRQQQRALNIDRRSYGDDHEHTGYAHYQLASVLLCLDDPRRAREHLSRAAKIWGELSLTDPRRARLQARWGELLLAEGEAKAAVAALADARRLATLPERLERADLSWLLARAEVAADAADPAAIVHATEALRLAQSVGASRTTARIKAWLADRRSGAAGAR